MRARVLNIAAAAEQMNILYSQHQALAEAILRHDAQRGVAIMEEHINKGIIDVEVLRKQYPNYFK
jgi:DNA-binding GntR family transcriptional regulator